MKKWIGLLLVLLFSLSCLTTFAEPRILVDGVAPDLASMDPNAAIALIVENAHDSVHIFSNEFSWFDAESGIAFFNIAADDYVNLRQLGRESAWFSLDVFGSVFEIPGCKSATISFSAPMTGGKLSRGMIASTTMKKETAETYDFDYYAEYVYADQKTVFASFDNYFVHQSVQSEFFKH